MKSGEEFQECGRHSDCVTEIIDEEGNVIGEESTGCEAMGQNGKICVPSTTSKQWKNYVKAYKEVRDSISKNKVHQSLLMEEDLEHGVAYSSILREKYIELYSHNLDDCITDTISVLVGSGFLKVSLTMIALLLFTIIA